MPNIKKYKHKFEEEKNSTKHSEHNISPTGFEILIPIILTVLAFVFNLGSYLNSTLHNLLSPTITSVQISMISSVLFWSLILFIIYKIMIPDFLINYETKQKIAKIHIWAMVIGIIILAFTGYMAQSPDQADQLRDRTADSVFSQDGNIFTEIKCNLYGYAINDPDCQRKAESSESETVEEQVISIDFEKDDRPRAYLSDPEDYFRVRYNFDTPTPIKIEKIKCYRHDKDEAFYEEEFENYMIDGQTSRQFECHDLGETIEERSTQIQIISQLYVTFSTQYSQEVPVINCENEEIRNYLESNNQKCEFLTLDEVRNNLDSTVIKSNPNPRGSNVLTVDTFDFHRSLPVRVGDNNQKTIDLDLEISGSRDIGEIQRGKINSLNLPNVLQFNSQDEQEKIQRELSTSKQKTLFEQIRLKESDRSLEPQDMVILQTLSLDIETTFVVRGVTTRTVEIIAEYIEEEN